MKKEQVKEFIMAEYERECKEIDKNFPIIKAILALKTNVDPSLVAAVNDAESFADTVLSDAAIQRMLDRAECIRNANRALGNARNKSDLYSALGSLVRCL